MAAARHAAPKVVGDASHPTLRKWHDALSAGLEGRPEAEALLADVLADDVEFNTPVYLKTRRGKPFALMALRGALAFFKDFRCVP